MARVKVLTMLRDACAQEFDALLLRNSMLRRDEVEVSEHHKKEEKVRWDATEASRTRRNVGSFAGHGQVQLQCGRHGPRSRLPWLRILAEAV